MYIGDIMLDAWVMRDFMLLQLSFIDDMRHAIYVKILMSFVLDIEYYSHI